MSAVAVAVAAAVKVDVDGAPVPDARVLSVRVAHRFDTPSQCEVTFAGAGWPAHRLGAPLRVTVAGFDLPLFEGDLTCVELTREPDGATTTRMRGYDRLHRLRRRQRVRALESVSVTELADLLCSDLGVTVVDAAGPDGGPAPGGRFHRLVQDRQSDLDLLVEVAARVGCHVALDGTVLRLCTLDGYGDPVDLHHGHSLYEVTVQANLDRAADSVTAYGWHPQRAEAATARAQRPRSGRQVGLDVPAGGAERYLLDQAAGEVAARAQAELDASAAGALVVDGVAAGDPRLRAGRRVRLAGAAEPVDGGYVVCSAVHTVDGAGYRTAFSTWPPVVEPVRRDATLTLGRVAAVDDPDGTGRVRVCLPAHGDVDAGWLAVLCSGAGPGKGLVALPDVGDTVLVALPHGGPVDGIVLGGLYGTTTPPDPGVSGGAVRRWSMRTADGQSIAVDDDAHSVRIADRAGSFVELGPDLLRLHAAGDLVVEAPGRAVTIRGRTVDFERAST
jgi:phage baseplate assembly protein gpV